MQHRRRMTWRAFGLTKWYNRVLDSRQRGRCRTRQETSTNAKTSRDAHRSIVSEMNYVLRRTSFRNSYKAFTLKSGGGE